MVGVVNVETPALTEVFQTIEFTSGISLTGGSGIQPPRVTATPATITKVIDSSSPHLVTLLAKDTTVNVRVELCNHTNFPNPQLKCDPTSVYATYTYEKAKLTKIAATASPMFTDKAEEDVTVTYERIIYNVGGNTGTTFCFDFATDRTC